MRHLRAVSAPRSVHTGGKSEAQLTNKQAVLLMHDIYSNYSVTNTFCENSQTNVYLSVSLSILQLGVSLELMNQITSKINAQNTCTF